MAWRPTLPVLLLALLTITGCADSSLLSGGWLGRRQVSSGTLLGSEQRRDPALSGDGRLLASISERQGRSSVILQEQASGRLLPLRHLRGHGPHRSPALSWNGRYLAVLVQQGMQTVAVVEDRLRGELLRLPAPAGASVERLTLAPDGQILALQLVQAGQQRVQVFDLSGLLEPDRAGGQRISDPLP